jgi:hypothetical protein
MCGEKYHLNSDQISDLRSQNVRYALACRYPGEIQLVTDKLKHIGHPQSEIWSDYPARRSRGFLTGASTGN